MSRSAPKISLGATPTHTHTHTHTHKDEAYGGNFIFFPLFPLKMGAYHTLDLQLNQKFTLAKEHWDFVALDRLGMGLSIHPLDLACDPTRTADVAAIVMQEGTVQNTK